ncbi:MAG: rhomboid family intramembrane serine protease [Crocinitomicaceae bacterium]|nr:rhomboid family intramembrane serine protease [Crocinitomicaceae bacterium]MDG1657321.1 rhomboid family intramembrane serine protease [Crocinitomicaceae bacterium]|tara:strand:- start:155 stop:949 length:795 start_codon:yes stop_codon:yes gene_type:complete
MQIQKHEFGSPLEAALYPLLLIVVMWLVFWADHLFPEVPFYHWGLIPKDPSTLRGIIFMPLLHAKNDIGHIMNNSVPTGILLAALIYYYRAIAARIFIISWLLTGIGLFVFADNTSSYHIGMSGMVYALAAFLFTSGVIRGYRPLQAIALFVAFVYGSMIWGIFPTEAHVSWEGHLSGMVVGVILAIVYRKRGPQAPKYIYEIEKELGIEPPDLEGQWNERVRLHELRQEELERQRKGHVIVYHYVPNKDNSTEQKPEDETDPQ